MRIDKIILKAALSTLTAIILLFGIMFAAFVFIYPSTMMTLAYDVGLDDASVWFADRAYKQLDDVYYIAYAANVSIGTGDSEKIEKYGGQFIADEGFGAYCEQMDKQTATLDGSYLQYVYRQVCVSKYRLGKTDEAIELAFSVNETCFPRQNAAAAVLLVILEQNKADELPAVEDIFARMSALPKETLPEEEREYLEAMMGLAQIRMESRS